MTSFKQHRKLPPLNALRVFEAVARHMSFKHAAEELCVSQSAVSHQIKILEEALSATLFTRETRKINLTRKGKLLYPIMRNAFDSIAEGSQMLLEESGVSVLNLHLYSTFTLRWLLPRLPRFQESHSHIQVRLHTSQDDVNFAEEDIDAAIIIGQNTDSSLHYDHLFDCELFPVCSPEYLHKHGPIDDHKELLQKHILQVYPSAGDWQMWLNHNKVSGISPDAGLQFESYDVALSSACQSMGIALGQQPYIVQELNAGNLIDLFPDRRVPNPNRWYLVCRSEKSQLSMVAALRDWLRQEVSIDISLPNFSRG